MAKWSLLWPLTFGVASARSSEPAALPGVRTVFACFGHISSTPQLNSIDGTTSSFIGVAPVSSCGASVELTLFFYQFSMGCSPLGTFGLRNFTRFHLWTARFCSDDITYLQTKATGSAEDVGNHGKSSEDQGRTRYVLVPRLYKLYIRRVKLMECDVSAKSSELTAFRPMFRAVFVFFPGQPGNL